MRVLDVVGIVILMVVIAIMVLAAMAIEAGVWASDAHHRLADAVPMCASGIDGSGSMRLALVQELGRSM